MKAWKKRGLLVGYRDGLHAPVGPPSKYEIAVAVHATCAMTNEILTNPRYSFKSKQIAASEAKS